MKILILGGRGNLGTQLTKAFSTDFETISWDRDDLDVLDFPILAEKINELVPDLIINTVAYNAVDKCEDKKEYELALSLNAELPAFLAELARRINAVLIHYSTDYVFNGTEDKREFTEDETPNPINKYGESKFAGEREILKQAEYGLSYYLIRTSKLFGPRGLSEFAKPSFFDIMLNLVEEKKDITVVNEELSCFTYTPDLAEATKRLWEVEAPFGIYHLINEGECTWLDGAKTLFELKKLNVPIRAVRSENLLRAARRPKFSVLKNIKLKKMRNFKDALREYLNN
ncbi:MAG: SDR family oxidoreductase [Patescibacteria group bacterium]